MNRIDWEEKLRHFVQVLAFALVIATIQHAFQPDRPYAPPVVYSILISTAIWAIVDLGRPFFPSSAETGWPPGWRGVLLVVGGIVGGWVIGTQLGDRLCLLWGFYGSAPPPNPLVDLRNSVLITLMAGSVGSFYFYAANKSAYLERQMAEARRHADEARLKLLETQLEPHMLFNTLANLRALIALDPPRAQAMLDHMIDYLRATLAASRAPAHPLRSEFDRLRDYLELMSIRMGPRLAYALDLPASLEQQRVPTLLLQPIVENAIQHGLEPQVTGGRVDVAARQEDGDIVLVVRDTGVGPGAHAPADGKGFGLSQVRARLQALYGERARVDVAPGEPGFVVTLRYPATS